MIQEVQSQQAKQRRDGSQNTGQSNLIKQIKFDSRNGKVDCMYNFGSLKKDKIDVTKNQDHEAYLKQLHGDYDEQTIKLISFLNIEK